jgi:fatty-acyl-CoA synthase
MPTPVELREETLGQLLDATVARHGPREALVYADREYRLSWQQVGDRVDRLARGLMAMGVQKGEKVAVWATNVPDWVLLMFAAAKIGAILVTINTQYRRTELAYVLGQSETENLFLIDGFRDIDYLSTVYDVVPELRDQPRAHLRSARFPHLKRVFFLGQEKHRGLYSMPELLAMGSVTSDADYRARQAGLTPFDVVNMQYTSGTTGFPKAVMLTHHNIANNGLWVGEHQRLTFEDRVCIPVPLFHCFGCVMGVLGCTTHGATMVLLEAFDPLLTMASVDKERCTALYGVPTMFIAILDHPLFDRFDYTSLRTGIMAGSPCPISTMQQVIERMHAREITICYGLTEGSPVMTQTHVDDDIRRKCETVGRAMPGVEVRVVDPDSRRDAPVGTSGEVVCRGYNVMRGYYRMPEATAQVIDDQQWLHTGDVGRLDADGYLTIEGRLKDIIIRGGENIAPLEIEEFLRRMPGVRDVQVVGVPSRKFGEEVAAFMILKDGASLTDDDVKDYCRGQIARFKIPAFVSFVDQYPLTASGKVQKYKLRETACTLWPDVDGAGPAARS